MAKQNSYGDATPVLTDRVTGIDTSDTTQDPAGSTKNFLLSAFNTLFGSSTQTLTNKSIDSDNNTITNIANADIKALAAIDAAKVADGSVSNTEYQYLNGVTSAIQTQLDAKLASSLYDDATASEANTGTSTAKYISPDALAGSNYGTAVVTVCLFDDSEDTAVGDGAGDQLYRIPSTLNGFDLVAVAAYVQTAGTTGTTDIQVHNVTQAADMLSTVITIDSAETDSSTAATAAVIDTLNDDVATGDKIRFDVDAVSTTAAKGLWVELQFRLP